MKAFDGFTLSIGIILLVILNWNRGCRAAETCFTCTNVTDYSQCSTIKTNCRQNEICYISDSVDGNGITRHTSGCMLKQVCTFLSATDDSSTSTPLGGHLFGRRDAVSYSCIKCCSNMAGNHPCNSRPCRSGSSHGPTTTASTSHTASHTTQGPLCMNCRDVISPRDCTLVTRCGRHEQCYMQQFVRDGRLLYDVGCRDSLRCQGNPGGLIGKRQSEPYEDVRRASDGRILTCESCCNKTVCNNGGACGTPEFAYVGRQLCFNCRQQRTTDSCDVVTLCPLHELCSIHQIRGYDGSTMWESGCDSVPNCNANGTTLCRSCCSNNLCNDKCSQNRTSGIPAHIISIEVNPRQIHYGDNVQITCHVESVPSYTNLDWLTQAAALPTNVHSNTTSDSATIYINNFRPENEAPYRCVVENALGSDKQDINIRTS